MKKILSALLGLSVILGFYSCNVTDGQIRPTISGKAGEVVVVCGDGSWDGALGNEFRSFLTDDCPFLPQREPMYNLIHVPYKGFSNMFKIHRNIIYVNIDSSIEQPEIQLKKDMWAQPQCFIQVNAASSADATTLVSENHELILSVIEQAERDRIIANSKKYQAYTLRPIVTQMVGGSPYFPSGYALKKQTQNFLWIAYDTQYVDQDVFVYKFPVDCDNPLDVDNLIYMRNQFLKENVPGPIENSYMITSTVIEPGYQSLKFRGRSFVQIKGLWEVENDYMGGPFVMHAFYSQDAREIIVVDGFVYAPKYDKRTYIRNIESILYSFEWKPEEEAEE